MTVVVVMMVVVVMRERGRKTEKARGLYEEKWMVQVGRWMGGCGRGSLSVWGGTRERGKLSVERKKKAKKIQRDVSIQKKMGKKCTQIQTHTWTCARTFLVHRLFIRCNVLEIV